jgi:hypothetical protein
MSTAPYYHTCLLVADIEDAVQRFSTGLGLAFAPILTTPDVRLHGAYQGEYELRWTFSREGPPYIELIEGQGDELFSLRQGERLHHLGRWAPSDQIAAVKSRVGEVLTVSSPGSEGNVWFADPTLFHGIWIELIDEGTRGDFEAWLASAG